MDSTEKKVSVVYQTINVREVKTAMNEMIAAAEKKRSGGVLSDSEWGYQTGIIAGLRVLAGKLGLMDVN